MIHHSRSFYSPRIPSQAPKTHPSSSDDTLPAPAKKLSQQTLPKSPHPLHRLKNTIIFNHVPVEVEGLAG